MGIYPYFMQAIALPSVSLLTESTFGTCTGSSEDIRSPYCFRLPQGQVFLKDTLPEIDCMAEVLELLTK